MCVTLRRIYLKDQKIGFFGRLNFVNQLPLNKFKSTNSFYLMSMELYLWINSIVLHAHVPDYERTCI